MMIRRMCLYACTWLALAAPAMAREIVEDVPTLTYRSSAHHIVIGVKITDPDPKKILSDRRVMVHCVGLIDNTVVAGNQALVDVVPGGEAFGDVMIELRGETGSELVPTSFKCWTE